MPIHTPAQRRRNRGPQTAALARSRPARISSLPAAPTAPARRPAGQSRLGRVRRRIV